MKIDCSITENYLKERGRMSNMCKQPCSRCELNSMRKKYNDDFCCELEITHCEEYKSMVQEWSDAHPQKTYLEDFKEKFPNNIHDYEYLMRVNCPYKLYGLKKEEKCNYLCVDCWNQIMEVNNA